jgi:putative transposase
VESYLTDLSDSQYDAILSNSEDDRKRKHSLREIFDGIFYLLKTGGQWRMVPDCFPKWELIYYYFSKWKNNGTIEMIHKKLRDITRKNAGKEIPPSMVLRDSQSVKKTRRGGLCRGVDGGKKTKGRKRHIITDTIGLLLAVVVHAANEHDSKAAPSRYRKAQGQV